MAQRKQPDALAIYRSMIESVVAQVSSGFVDSIKSAIRSHDRIAASGFLAWHLAQSHPAVGKVVSDILNDRYALVDSRRFAAWLMDHCPDVDDQYMRRFLALLQSTFERLDWLLREGKWKLPKIPNLKQIESKIAELGGVPELHRNWVRQRSQSVRAASDDEWQQKGFASQADMQEFEQKRRASRQHDADDKALRQFAAEAVEFGQRIERLPGAGLGIYVETSGGIIVKLPPDHTRLIVAYLGRTKALI